MKKLIVGLLAAVLMAAGLVATTSTSAQAGCDASRYGGCSRTSTAISGDSRSRVGQVKSYIVSVSVNGNDRRPRGTVQLIIRGVGKNTRGQGLTATKSARRVVEFNVGRGLPKGKYQVRAVFRSNGTQFDSRSRTIGLKNRPGR